MMKQAIFYALMFGMIFGPGTGLAAGYTQARVQGRPPVRQVIYTRAKAGDVRALKALQARGISLEARDAKGNTALCEATWRKDRVAFQALRSAGANLGAACMNRIPASYKTAMGLSPATATGTGAGTTGAGLAAATTAETAGLSTAAMVGIGVGAVALVGGGVALAAGGGGGGSSSKGGKPQDTGGETCAGYTLTTCPANGDCDTCTDRDGNTRYTLTKCHAGYDRTGNTCVAHNCAAEGYRATTCTANETQTGTCRSGASTWYKCQAKPVDKCENINCGAHGTCSDGMCVCSDNYYGPQCETAPLNCGAHGTWNQETKACDCSDGYTGTICQTAPVVDKCENINCGAHGTCSDGMCVCSDNYYGPRCETAPLNCGAHGTWNPATKACDCSDGYTGTTCQTAPVVDKCAGITCQGGGTCNSDTGMCTCDTTQGWVQDGQNCKPATCAGEALTACPSHKPIQKASCISGGQQYLVCEEAPACPAGQYGDGTTCTQCPNGSTSAAGATQISDCTCPDKWQDPNTFQCYTPLNCVHGTQSGNMCLCENGWTGDLCDTCPLTGDHITNCACDDGYTLVGNECLITIENCASYNPTNGQCSACNKGFFLTSKGTCKSGSIFIGAVRAAVFFKGEGQNRELTISHETEIHEGLYPLEGDEDGVLLPMIAAWGVPKSDIYADITIENTATLKNTEKGGLLAYLNHANLTNNGILEGNIILEDWGTITNRENGKMTGDITSEGDMSNAGEMNGNIFLEINKVYTNGNIFANFETGKITGSLSIINRSNSQLSVQNYGEILSSDGTTDTITLSGNEAGSIIFTNNESGNIENSFDITQGILINKGKIKGGIILDGDMTNYGEIEGDIISSATSVIHNTESGIIKYKNDVVLDKGTLKNEGTLLSDTGNFFINKEGVFENMGTLTLPLTENFSGPAFYSAGTINNSGTLSGYIYSAGTFSNSGIYNGLLFAGGIPENEYVPAGDYSGGSISNTGTMNGYELPNGVHLAIAANMSGTFTNHTTGVINGMSQFENRTSTPMTIKNDGRMGTLWLLGKDDYSFSVINDGEIDGTVSQIGGTMTNNGTISNLVTLNDGSTSEEAWASETVFTNNGLIVVDNKASGAEAVAIGANVHPVYFYNYGTVRVSNGVFTHIINDEYEEMRGSVITAFGDFAHVSNAGTLEIVDSTLITENYITNTKTTEGLTATSTTNEVNNAGYFIQLWDSASLQNSGVINTNLLALDLAKFTPDGTGKTIALPGAQFVSKKSISGNLYLSSAFLTDNFDNTVVVKDMFETPDTSGLNLISQSALFDAKLAENGTDVIMTKKSFATLTGNGSLASFLEKNYTAGRNEGFFNTLKSLGTVSEFNGALRSMTGLDNLTRFAHEDLTALRDMNLTMNAAMFANDDKPLFQTQGSLTAFSFKNDRASGGQYALANRRISPSVKVGYALSMTRLNTGKDTTDTRNSTVFQVATPVSLTHGRVRAIMTPTIGFARGHYNRSGFNGTTYKGTLEKRFAGVMNEARVPMTVAGWEVSPTMELNAVAYNQRGNEEDKAFSLTIPSDNRMSVEGGMGLHVARTYTWGRQKRLNLTAGIMGYREFANPYNIKMGMSGMDGTFDLYDDRVSAYRGVANLGLDFTAGEWQVFGSLRHYMERETHTDMTAGLKYRF